MVNDDWPPVQEVSLKGSTCAESLVVGWKVTKLVFERPLVDTGRVP